MITTLIVIYLSKSVYIKELLNIKINAGDVLRMDLLVMFLLQILQM